MQCNYHSCAGPVFRRYLLASPQRGTLSQGVGEASSQPQHQQVALPQIANLLFLDADVTQLCQIQHNCVSEREKNIKIQDSAPSICAETTVLALGCYWPFSCPFLHKVRTKAYRLKVLSSIRSLVLSNTASSHSSMFCMATNRQPAT